MRTCGRCAASEVSAFARGRLVLGLAAAGAALLAAAGLLVDRGPGAASRLLGPNATILVALLDMSGLALLLGGVCRFRSSGHNAHSLVATVIVGATRSRRRFQPRFFA
jgi:hypothetical protein